MAFLEDRRSIRE
ncbi:hypothetical protein Patl1_11802 [Pistacia atlantica]|uniref:Uncharacterized protein n=1 Tax=Pistacia atlantica TaxID=434234 RepID=A0ACC1A3X9_9ROSI|nr:hypothetical protein Patl1_11802 [Pistacia atlantica]